jgi:hypothetical protein
MLAATFVAVLFIPLFFVWTSSAGDALRRRERREYRLLGLLHDHLLSAPQAPDGPEPGERPLRTAAGLRQLRVAADALSSLIYPHAGDPAVHRSLPGTFPQDP